MASLLLGITNTDPTLPAWCGAFGTPRLKETPQLKSDQCGVCSASNTFSVKAVMGQAR